MAKAKIKKVDYSVVEVHDHKYYRVVFEDTVFYLACYFGNDFPQTVASVTYNKDMGLYVCTAHEDVGGCGKDAVKGIVNTPFYGWLIGKATFQYPLKDDPHAPGEKSDSR